MGTVSYGRAWAGDFIRLASQLLHRVLARCNLFTGEYPDSLSILLTRANNLVAYLGTKPFL